MSFFKRPAFHDPAAPVYWNLWVMAVLTVLAIPLLFLDQRELSGSYLWIKPIKFSLSIGIYSLTLLWMLPFFEGKKSIISKISWTIIVTGFIEIVAIFGQAARGEQSHFNVSSSFNAFLFTLMGISIGIFWIMHLVLSFHLVRQKTLHPFLRESLLWGLFISAYGMIIGFFMTTPRPEQIELMKQGILQTSGGHTFGAPDGGPGLALLGWSTIAGDLRVAHFFGMHALQIFSLISILFLGLDGKKNIAPLSRLPLRFLGIAILGITLTMNIQALNGESIFKTTSHYFSSYTMCMALFSIGMVMLGFNLNKKQIAT
ncbi:hypothetical protein EHQ58_03640 [Leptospira ognonensis]|uniref:Uncharacterized protein n=1 Tax=Leptospira ognonensis TaxID=2484945 RepID=A0A4R9K9E2_9LEPT|nr:hypothetical protein [Leptospira ognonensis]TGL62302.1 hypothetical protein EHQ58_03640 [Leptospira ognonensis]